MDRYTYLGAVTAGVFVTVWAMLAGMGYPVDGTVGGLLVGILTGGAAVAGVRKKAQPPAAPDDYEIGGED